MSCSGDEHRFAPSASACDCGQTHSSLASGGLPYASWRLDDGPRRGLRHSNFATATDTQTGRRYLVREYVPDAVPDASAQRRRFITVAKSLRSSPVASERILFAYTRGTSCYTVAEPIVGSPLSALRHPSATPGPDGLNLIQSLLSALRQFHAAAGSAGPFFHGHLRFEDILISGSGLESKIHLLHSLYLDNLLRENPLPPEHFQQQDILAAADITLALAAGPGSAATRQARVQRLTDPLLRATLNYLCGINGPPPHSADAALSHIELLRKPAPVSDRAAFGRPTPVPPSSPPSATPQPPPASPSPLHPPAPGLPPIPEPRVPRPPTTPPPFRPVAVPPATSRKRNSGCGGCLFTLLFALLIVGAITALLTRRTPAPTTLDFTADPNPAPRKTHVELHWTSSGFQRLELDGKRVQANGSLNLVPKNSHRYTLEGIRPDGSRDIRELDLTLVPHPSAKPDRDTSAKPSPASEEPATEGENPWLKQPQQAVQPQPPAAPGSSPPAEGTNASATPGEAQPPAPIVRELPAADMQEINTALRQWTEAMLSNEPDREAACYAPQLDRYFLRSDVTQDFVRRYLTAFHNQGTIITAFNISDVQAYPESDGSAELRFNKAVDLATPSGPKHQAVHSTLRLKRFNGSWKITFERDFFGPLRQP